MQLVNRSIFPSLSDASRVRKLEILRAAFRFDASTTILDVGGQVEGAQAQFINQYPHPENITVVNVLAEHLEAIRQVHPGISTRLADARDLPFADKSFDLAFSNAVIEHVGDWRDQEAMAKEIMRVARNWFVTTPNRWFPFEFHLRLPFVSWLPGRALHRVARAFSYDHVVGRYRRGVEQRLRLLTRRELGLLFPGSAIHALRVTVAPETLIAMGGESLEPRIEG